MDIVSIAPATRTAALGRAAVEVSGLSLRKLTRLITEYPDLLAFAGGGTIDLAGLLARAPDMALAIFAVGVVGPARPRWWRRWQPINEEDLIGAFDRAATGQQLDAVADIVDLTFEGTRGTPFLKSVLAVAFKSASPSPDSPSQSPTPEPPMPASSNS